MGGFFGETGIIITLEQVPNFELEQLILSYSDRVKVLEPESLQQKITARLTQAIEHYPGKI